MTPVDVTAPRKPLLARVRSPRYWLLQTVLAAAWIGVWHLGRMLELTPSSSLWFPPAGMTFAMFLAEGVLALPAVAVGVTVSTFQWAAILGDPRTPGSILLTGLAFCTAHCMAYGAGARLFDRLFGDDRFARPLSVVSFLGIATVSSLVAASAGLASLVWSGAPDVRPAADLVPWWIGDLVAVVTLGPFFLLVIDRATRAIGLPSSGWSASLERLGPGSTGVGAFAAKLAVTATVVITLGLLTAAGDLGVPVALAVYVVAVPLMWIAHTEGGHRTVLAVAFLATSLVILTRLLGLAEQAFNYQAAMIAIAGFGLFNLTVPRLYADNRRLLSIVTYDQLTGARTRTAFLAAAEEALDARRSDSGPVSLLVFDIDHFKSVNDSFGHTAGDTVLAGVGAICRRELRGVDLLGRLGGEEFAVLLPDQDRSAATAVAERLRSLFATAPWDARLRRHAVTASFGVVQIEPGETVAAAFERADAALYIAKRAGRDRVRVA